MRGDDMTSPGTLMDLAATSDRGALFAALQRALLQLADARLRPATGSGRDALAHDLEYILEGLQVGDTLGSPDELAARRRRDT
jgi:hypothetical protein